MKKVYEFTNIDLEKKLLGPYNINLEIISEKLKASLILSNHHILVSDDLNDELFQKVKDCFELIEGWIIKFGEIVDRDVQAMAIMLSKHTRETVEIFLNNRPTVIQTFDGRIVTAKSLTQSLYLKALQTCDITIATGSAGTGKTYLGVAYALGELKKNSISKIIITRPVVEAGEKLGFLPGDLKEKIDPYLIPIYDSIEDIVGHERLIKYLEKGTIEIAPLAYMRGRTLDNAIIILDEAQNTTKQQMKMFLTRLGFNSKMIITGDITQIDLLSNKHSGLIDAKNKLEGIEHIKIITFERFETLRHPLVAEILNRYDNSEGGE